MLVSTSVVFPEGVKPDPTSAKPTNTINCTTLHVRSYTESRANRTSCSVIWNHDVQMMAKKPMYAYSALASVIEWYEVKVAKLATKTRLESVMSASVALSGL